MTAVAVAFADAAPRMKRKDAVVTGNPDPQGVLRVAAAAQPATEQPQRLLVFGGSQGSRVLNDTMTGALLFLARAEGRLDIVHQTGPNELDESAAARIASRPSRTRASCRISIRSSTRSRPRTSSSRRAGAMTIGELAAVGRAAILVPFAAATNNHQELNARVVEKAGGAVVITEKELTPERLAGAIAEVVADPRAASSGWERRRRRWPRRTPRKTLSI